MKPNEHLLVQDLLPSYVDGLTCSDTSAYVKSHLETCAVCRASYEAMKHPCRPKTDNPPVEVDYLKRLRHHISNNLIWIFFLVACLFGVCLQTFVYVPASHVHVEELYRLSSGKLYAEIQVDPPYSAADFPFYHNADMVDVHGNIDLSFSTSFLNCLVEYARGKRASPAIYTYIFDPAANDLPAGDFLSLGYSWSTSYHQPVYFWQGEPLPPAPADVEAQWNDHRGSNFAQWRKELSHQFPTPQ